MIRACPEMRAVVGSPPPPASCHGCGAAHQAPAFAVLRVASLRAMSFRRLSASVSVSRMDSTVANERPSWSLRPASRSVLSRWSRRPVRRKAVALGCAECSAISVCPCYVTARETYTFVVWCNLLYCGMFTTIFQSRNPPERTLLPRPLQL